MTNSERLKKLDNGQKRHARSLTELRALIREGLAAHEKQLRDHDRQFREYQQQMREQRQQMKEHRQQMKGHQEEHRQEMKDLDERILKLVSSFGEFLRQVKMK